jgi:hypothetical protein
MHGLSLAAEKMGRFSYRYGQPVLANRPSNALEVACANLLDLNRHLVTAFRSPPATARYQATAKGSKFLACHFDVTPIYPTDPFGPELHPSLFGRGLSASRTRYLPFKPVPSIRNLILTPLRGC